MPPIMGAAAYMMLEIVEPAVTYLEIIKAALLPAVLYYTGMLCMVHFAARSRRHAPGVSVHSSEEVDENGQKEKSGKLLTLQGGIFLAAFITLIGVLLMGATAFRAVSWSLLVVIAISLLDFLIRRIRGRHSTEGEETSSLQVGVGVSDLRKGDKLLNIPL